MPHPISFQTLTKSSTTRLLLQPPSLHEIPANPLRLSSPLLFSTSLLNPTKNPHVAVSSLLDDLSLRHTAHTRLQATTAGRLPFLIILSMKRRANEKRKKREGKDQPGLVVLVVVPIEVVRLVQIVNMGAVLQHNSSLHGNTTHKKENLSDAGSL
ncbi:alpha/beta-Hydrolases superfamily protein [Striga asiatica]|uniref:Alpha/beta-Hydrolases superfamily protein n=1 Tax=Striga asiatica TaxID=4170 RepID=A0A5A7QVG8_STRAF|nr:alpha/beta-Hydrolases superfamily protein [Striga asiatica]